ncbi:MAG: membrane protein insertase YidC [Bacteroidetes bacterium]|nr:membrane protein insertase YidC [Bacteroidota bacterium]
MDRNTIIGFVLIIVVLIGYTYYNQPTEEEQEAYRGQQDSIASFAKRKANDSLANQVVVNKVDSNVISSSDSVVADQNLSQFGAFATSSTGQAKDIVIENEKIIVTLTTKGGYVKQVELKNTKTYDGKPLYLYEKDSTATGINFFSENRSINTTDLFFAPQGPGFAVEGNASKTLVLRIDAGNNRSIDYEYSLAGNSYELKYSIRMNNMQSLIAANTSYLEMDWNATLPRLERKAKGERQYSTINYVYSNGENDYLSETEDEKESLNEKIKWISFKQHFFSSILYAEKSFENAQVATYTDFESEDKVRTMKANMRIPYNRKPDESFAMAYYFGPNHYSTLKSFDRDYEKSIQLGWGILGWINRFIVIPVFNWLKNFGLSFGIVILVLTIIIKLILLPLNYRAYLSSAKMRVLQPEVTELQSKFKEEPLKMQQEMMGLYRKAGVSPLGGCWPMLLQMPILFAMLRFFPASFELRQEAFLWARDLSTYDSIFDLGFNIPGYGDHVSLWTILMTLSTLLFTYYNSQQLNTSANPAMKYMMYLMPLIFLGFLNDFPAGLNYYYFLGNIISIATQFLFKGMVNHDAIIAKIEANKKKPQSQKKSGFQERLEKMARERGYQPPKKK